jgi:hypothetical protein
LAGGFLRPAYNHNALQEAAQGEETISLGQRISLTNVDKIMIGANNGEMVEFVKNDESSGGK